MTSSPLETPADPRAWQHALLLVAFATLLRVVLAVSVPLVADEAYYWEWSRRLAFGYFDHPPVIAWLIAAGTAVLGDTPLGVRALPILTGAFATLALALAARELAGDRAARFVTAVFALMPLSLLGFVLATPDAPLLTALALCFLQLVRATSPDRAAAERSAHWLGAGVAIGFAMASKFTGVFIPIAVALAVLLHPGLRTELRRPGAYLAVAVASLVMLPVLLWNADYDWIAFRFQLGHGLGTTSRGSWWQRELDLLGGQAGLVTPILFVLFIGAIVRAARPSGEPRRFLLATSALFSIAFFIYSATRRSVEANWPAIAWLPALILLAAEARSDAHAEAAKAQRGAHTAATEPPMRTPWERRGLALAGALSLLVVFHIALPFLPIAPRKDPVSRAYGWDQLADAVATRRAATSTMAGQDVHTGAQRYQDAALIAFNDPSHPTVFGVNLLGRRNQYDLWPRITDTAQPGDVLLLVVSDTSLHPALVDSLRPHFGDALPEAPTVITRDGAPLGARRIWTLTAWRGTWPADPNDPRQPR